MSNPVAPGRLSFEENLNTLLEELVLAGKWSRPSILLAVLKSKFGQEKAQKALEERLTSQDQKVIHIVVDKERSDIPHLMIAAPAADRAVFFVSNLDWGGGSDHRDAYRALNMYRELFVDNHLRLVLWLTINEASALARFAPDFWSFRHRVVEFTGQRIPRQVKLPAGVLIWDVQNSVDPFDTLPARIAVREELLARLPHNAEARSSRIDLLYNLGYLYWEAGNSEKAAEELNAGLDLATGPYAGEIRSALLNGLAILSYETRDYARAANVLQQALQSRSEDATLLINLSVTSNALGRNQEALRLAKQATRIKERDARVWAAQGYIYAAMGKFDDSIASFDKAIQLAPRSAPCHAALAICYDLVERVDDAARDLEMARNLASAEYLLSLDIYEAALSGAPASAAELIQSAARTGQIPLLHLRRDPNLSLLMDAEQIGQVSA